MVLRRRDEQGIIKAIARLTICEAPQDPASTNGDRSVDRVDAISEARSDLVEPYALTRRPGSPTSFRCSPRSQSATLPR